MNLVIPQQVILYGYCVFGALLLWGRLTLAKKKMYSYADVLENIISNDKLRYVVQFLIFVIIGGFVAKILTSPSTEAQAMAAGMAWSRLTAKD